MPLQINLTKILIFVNLIWIILAIIKVFLSLNTDFIGNMPGPPAVSSLEPLGDSRSSLHLLLNLFHWRGLTRDMSPHRLCEGDTWLDGCRHTVDHCELPLNRRCVGESCPSPHLETALFASSVQWQKWLVSLHQANVTIPLQTIKSAAISASRLTAFPAL